MFLPFDRAGAGKSTLIKLMCDELKPTEGQIRPHMHLVMGASRLRPTALPLVPSLLSIDCRGYATSAYALCPRKQRAVLLPPAPRCPRSEALRSRRVALPLTVPRLAPVTGRYNQHSEEQLDVTATPLEFLRTLHVHSFPVCLPCTFPCPCPRLLILCLFLLHPCCPSLLIPRCRCCVTAARVFNHMKKETQEWRGVLGASLLPSCVRVLSFGLCFRSASARLLCCCVVAGCRCSRAVSGLPDLASVL